MIRQNPPKANAQKSVYYTNRFDVVPTSPMLPLGESQSFLQALHTPITQSYIQNDLTTLWVESTQILALIKELFALGYDFLTEMSAIDKLEENNEFELFYLLLKLDEQAQSVLKSKQRLKKGSISPHSLHFLRVQIGVKESALICLGLSLMDTLICNDCLCQKIG